MKRVLFFLIVCMFATAVRCDNLTSSQIALRSQIKQFLATEGFMPTIDSDGDIAFKKEGKSYYITVSATDTDPMYVTLKRQFSVPETDANVVRIACALLNEYKGVKLMLYDNALVAQYCMYLDNAEYFNGIFYKIMKVMTSLINEYDDKIAEAQQIMNGR